MGLLNQRNTKKLPYQRHGSQEEYKMYRNSEGEFPAELQDTRRTRLGNLPEVRITHGSRDGRVAAGSCDNQTADVTGVLMMVKGIEGIDV